MTDSSIGAPTTTLTVTTPLPTTLPPQTPINPTTESMSTTTDLSTTSDEGITDSTILKRSHRILSDIVMFRSLAMNHCLILFEQLAALYSITMNIVIKIWLIPDL